jgi:hypothetical protein
MLDEFGHTLARTRRLADRRARLDYTPLAIFVDPPTPSAAM